MPGSGTYWRPAECRAPRFGAGPHRTRPTPPSSGTTGVRCPDPTSLSSTRGASAGGLRRCGVDGGSRDPVLRALRAGPGHGRVGTGELPRLPELRRRVLRGLLEPRRRRVPQVRPLPPRRFASFAPGRGRAGRRCIAGEERRRVRAQARRGSRGRPVPRPPRRGAVGPAGGRSAAGVAAAGATADGATGLGRAGGAIAAGSPACAPARRNAAGSRGDAGRQVPTTAPRGAGRHRGGHGVGRGGGDRDGGVRSVTRLDPSDCRHAVAAGIDAEPCPDASGNRQSSGRDLPGRDDGAHRRRASTGHEAGYGRWPSALGRGLRCRGFRDADAAGHILALDRASRSFDTRSEPDGLPIAVCDCSRRSRSHADA